MKKIILIFIGFIAVLNITAQEPLHKFDYKFGSGLGFMGSGDLMARCFENELNYKLNNYFTTSVGLGIGRTPQSTKSHNDYLMGSLNVFVSPFKNNRRNNFRVGGGYSMINETSSYNPYDLYLAEDTYNGGYDYMTRMVNGFSIIVEDEYRIGSRFLVGGKFFVTGGWYEGGVVSGGIVKLGVIL